MFRDGDADELDELITLAKQAKRETLREKVWEKFEQIAEARSIRPNPISWEVIAQSLGVESHKVDMIRAVFSRERADDAPMQ